MKDFAVCTMASEDVYEKTGTPQFIKSFKKFHPDIDLHVFTGNDCKKLFAEKPWLTWANCKASFSKLLYHDYKTVINIDADHLIFSRLDEVFTNDYELGCVANFNITYNLGLYIKIPEHHYEKPYVLTERECVQCGIVGSSSKQFWDNYEKTSKERAKQFVFGDMDLLSILFHYGPYKTKVFDGHLDFNHPEHKFWYNSSSLGKEHLAYIENDKIMLEGKQMKAYHWSKGADYPKPRYREVFSKEVSEWIDEILK